MARVTLLNRRVTRAVRDHLAYARYRRARRSAETEASIARLLHVVPSPYDQRARLVTWFSPILGIPKQLQLYLPPGYATSGERYPVLYLLRGHEREWLNTNEDQTRAGQNVIDRAALARHGVAISLPEAVMDDGEHSWRTADRHMAQTLPIHWQQLRP